MKNFEVPLNLAANKEKRGLKTDTIAQAHRIYAGLEEDEYCDEAPDLQELTPRRLFAELEGPTWEERREQININRQVERLPKCLDIPLAFASSGNIDQARWLIEDMIDKDILHEPSSEHREYFEKVDIQEEAFEQIAEAEAEKRREEVIRNLRRDSFQ